ncbi:MAG: hypothetical protein K940chlam2_01104 [Chlamydiae bacterium]|nr:hypothetical protein [Chlamydiota bacterium]
MTRMSKKEKRRAIFPRKRKNPSPKTGALKDNLPQGYREHSNAIEHSAAFIPKIK